MKVIPLLLLPVLLTSCGLLQMPARALNSILGPLTEHHPTAPSSNTSIQVALEAQTSATPTVNADPRHARP